MLKVRTPYGMGPTENCRSSGLPDFLVILRLGPGAPAAYDLSFLSRTSLDPYTQISVCHPHGITKARRGSSAHHTSSLDLEQLLVTAFYHRIPLFRTWSEAATLPRLDSFKTNNPLIEHVLPTFTHRFYLLPNIHLQRPRFPTTLSHQAEYSKHEPYPTQWRICRKLQPSSSRFSCDPCSPQRPPL